MRSTFRFSLSQNGFHGLCIWNDFSAFGRRWRKNGANVEVGTDRICVGGEYVGFECGSDEKKIDFAEFLIQFIPLQSERIRERKRNRSA